MERIRMSTSLASTSFAYVFPINPSKIETLENLDKQQINILHGAPAWQIISYDGRQRTMYWNNFLQNDTIMEGLIIWLRTRRKIIKYINFGILNDVVKDWPNATANGYWKKCRIIDVETSIQPGGTIKYDEIKLIIQPEQ